jgi:hypothetical protein
MNMSTPPLLSGKSGQLESANNLHFLDMDSGNIWRSGQVWIPKSRKAAMGLILSRTHYAYYIAKRRQFSSAILTSFQNGHGDPYRSHKRLRVQSVFLIA